MTNQQIYFYNQKLNIFNGCQLKLPVKINFYLQKNINTIRIAAEEIEKMAGYVDVFLVDIKYFSPEYSKKYSGAYNYYECAKSALGAMLKIAPEVVFNEEGKILSGVIVRHLVLPNLRKDSINVLKDLKNSSNGI